MSWWRAARCSDACLEDERGPLLLNFPLAELSPAELADVLVEVAVGQDQKESFVHGLGPLAPWAIEAGGFEALELFRGGRMSGTSMGHDLILDDRRPSAETFGPSGSSS